MTTGLVWAIILGAVTTIGLFSLIPLWIVLRFPDRAPHGTEPAYLRRATVTTLPRRSEAPGHDTPTRAAA